MFTHGLDGHGLFTVTGYVVRNRRNSKLKRSEKETWKTSTGKREVKNNAVIRNSM